MAQSIKIGSSSSWKSVSAVSVGVSSAWKTVSNGWVGVSGVWEPFYSSELTFDVVAGAKGTPASNANYGFITTTGDASGNYCTQAASGAIGSISPTSNPPSALTNSNILGSNTVELLGLGTWEDKTGATDLVYMYLEFGSSDNSLTTSSIDFDVRVEGTFANSSAENHLFSKNHTNGHDSTYEVGSPSFALSTIGSYSGGTAYTLLLFQGNGPSSGDVDNFIMVNTNTYTITFEHPASSS